MIQSLSSFSVSFLSVARIFSCHVTPISPSSSWWPLTLNRPRCSRAQRVREHLEGGQSWIKFLLHDPEIILNHLEPVMTCLKSVQPTSFVQGWWVNMMKPICCTVFVPILLPISFHMFSPVFSPIVLPYFPLCVLPMHLPIFFRCFLPNFLPDFLPYDLPYVLPNPSLSYLSLSITFNKVCSSKGGRATPDRQCDTGPQNETSITTI